MHIARDEAKKPSQTATPNENSKEKSHIRNSNNSNSFCEVLIDAVLYGRLL